MKFQKEEQTKSQAQGLKKLKECGYYTQKTIFGSILGFIETFSGGKNEDQLGTDF